MFDLQFSQGVELYKMLKNNPNIRDSIFGLMRRFIDFTLQGGYNPKTLEFQAMVPSGEPNKIFIVLQVAEVLTEPLPEFEYDPKDSSAQLVNFVNSMYSAVLGHNSEIAAFIHYCPTLANNIYAIARLIYFNFYQYSRQDFVRRIVWDSYDFKEHSHYEGFAYINPEDPPPGPDFVITGFIPSHQYLI